MSCHTAIDYDSDDYTVQLHAPDIGKNKVDMKCIFLPTYNVIFLRNVDNKSETLFTSVF